MDRWNGYEKYKYDDTTVFGTITSSDEPEHSVEDARTKKRDPLSDERTNEKTRKKRKRANGNRTGLLLVISITILCFCLTVVAADLFSGKASLSTYANLLLGRKDKTNHTVYYLVCATRDADMGVAYKNAAAIRKEGGAGYVLKSGEDYYVVLNAYEKKEDAEKIRDKQGNYGILELKLPAFDLEKAKGLKGATLSETLYEKVFRTLYETANAYQRGVYSADDVKIRLNPIKEEVAACEEAFERSASDLASTVVLDYKVLLRTMKSSLENILSSESDPLSLLRYYAVSVLHSQSLFREKYFA